MFETIVILVASLLAVIICRGLFATEAVTADNLTLLTASPKTQLDASRHNGRLRISADNFTIANGVTTGSTYTCHRLPRDAVIWDLQLFIETAAVDIADLDFGCSNDDDALVDGYDTNATGGWHDLWGHGTVTAAEMGKPLWELCGYSNREDAPAMIDLLYTTRDTADAASECCSRILWTVD